MDHINPYDFFGVTANSSLKDVREAYYRMALLCHPDKGGTAESMNQIAVAYQWIQSQLMETEEHRKTFEEYYGEKIKDTHVKSFTDVLAETYDYTRERFNRLCSEKGVTTSTVMEMLFIPAFEWALQQKATPETLQENLEAFLEMYRADMNTATDSTPASFYIPMSSPDGYDSIISKHADDEYSYEHNKEKYMGAMTTYQSPKTLTDWKSYGSMLESRDDAGTSISATEKPNFTTFGPTAAYDYEEAFQMLSTETTKKDPVEPLETQLKLKLEERDHQDERFWGHD